MKDYKLTLKNTTVYYQGSSPRDAVTRFFNTTFGIKICIQQAFGSAYNCTVQLMSARNNKINYYYISHQLNQNNKLYVGIDSLLESDSQMIKLLDRYARLEFPSYARPMISLREECDTLGISIGNKLIGYCAVSKTEAFNDDFGSNKKIGYLTNLFIMKRYRGRLLGIYFIRKIFEQYRGIFDIICVTCVTDDEMNYYKSGGFISLDDCLLYHEL